MTKIDTTVFTNWTDGTVIKAEDYKRERDLTAAAVNASDDQIKDRYTKAEVDSKDANLSSQILQVSLGNPPQPPTVYTPITLNNGLQVINNTTRQTTLKGYNLKGRTLINLLGQDGNCESVAGASYFQATGAVNTANFVYGSASNQVTISTGATGARQFPLNLLANKCYIFLTDAKNGNATSVRVGLAGGVIISQTYSGASAFSPIWFKHKPSSNLSTSVDITIIGTAGQYGYFDGVRVYEITQAEYDALGTTLTDINAIAAKYPHTEGIQGVWNPYVYKYGKNLLPSLRNFNLNSGSPIALSSYSGTVNTTDKFITQVPAVGGQAYSLSVQSSDTNGRLFASTIVNGVTTTLCDISGTGIIKSENFVTPAGTTYIEVRLLGLSASPTTVSDPMLNVGSTALTFEPQVNELLAIQDTFHANIDGTTPDELNEVGGKLIKTQNYGTLDLTGDLAWLYHGDNAGSKIVKFVHTNVVNAKPNTSFAEQSYSFVTKYNGKPLTFGTTNATIDNFNVWSDGSAFFSISDTDSGWGESYTPTVAEIQAYFYGWQMYTSPAGDSNPASAPYTGSGTKAWAYRNTSGAYSGGTTTLPTSPSYSLNLSAVQSYKLLYRLATPVTYEVTSEGSITLHEGNNQVETGVGMVVRERANPQVNSSYMVINHTSFPSSQLKNRANRIKNVYKSSLMDETWAHFTGSEYGTDRVSTLIYDASGSYTVTYSALDLYKLSASLTSVTASYAPNDKTRLDDALEKANRAEATVRALQNVKAEKNQPQWIDATMFNGWIAFDPAYPTLRYYKDSTGRVHFEGLIKSGTTSAGTVISKFPNGYRPSKSVLYGCGFSNSGTLSLGNYEVRKTGEVVIGSILGSTWVEVRGSFYAEN